MRKKSVLTVASPYGVRRGDVLVTREACPGVSGGTGPAEHVIVRQVGGTQITVVPLRWWHRVGWQVKRWWQTAWQALRVAAETVSEYGVRLFRREPPVR